MAKTLSPTELSRFRLHPSLIAAIRASSLTLVALGAPVGLDQGRVSKFIGGSTFGLVTRDRFVALGASLGIPEEGCVVRIDP